MLQGMQLSFSVEFAEESSLKVLPEGMFDSCVRLKTVQLPGKIKAIGKRAFYRCKELNELFLPKGLEEIRKEAFYFCGIESLDFPEGLKKIEEHAFFRCKKLRKVKLPSSVEYIGKEAFHGCDWLEILEIRHDPEFLGDWLVNRNCTIYCVEGSKVDKYCDKFEYKREYVTREANGNG